MKQYIVKVVGKGTVLKTISAQRAEQRKDEHENKGHSATVLSVPETER